MPDVDNMGANMLYSKLIPAHLKFGAKSRNWLARILRWPLLKQASLNPCGHLSLFPWLWLRLALALWNFDLN